MNEQPLRPRNSACRGRTSSQRLSLLDPLLATRLREALIAHDALGTNSSPAIRAPVVVDFGFGDIPKATLRWRDLLVARGLCVSMVGIEASQSRVDAARRSLRDAAMSDARLSFERASFDLQPLLGRRVVLIRSMNVLRGYRVEQVAPAQRLLLKRLVPGGFLVEGTSDQRGHLLSAHVWRRGAKGIVYRGLWFATDFERGFAPRMFRDVLPRDLRRHAREDEPVARWLAAWQHAFERAPVPLSMARTSRERSRFRFHSSLERLCKELEDAQTLLRFAAVEPFARAAFQPEAALRQAPLGEAAAVLWTPPRPSFRPEVLSPRSLDESAT